MNVLRAGAALGFVSVLLAACSGSEVAPASNQGASGSGSLDGLTVADLSDAQLQTLSGDQAALRVLMTDAPVEAEHVNVTVCKVQVHAGDDASAEGSGEVGADAGAAQTDGDAGSSSVPGWRTVAEGCRSFDLLALRDGVTTDLGLDTLPAGSYGMIRLNVSEASIVVDGQEHTLTIPSGAQRGIKIVHHFELIAGELTTLALDFDAARSIHESADGYVMRPVITPVGERHESFADAARPHADAGQPHPGQEDRIHADAGAPSDVGAARAVHPESGKPDSVPHAH
jgi:hypothetical protein